MSDEVPQWVLAVKKFAPGFTLPDEPVMMFSIGLNLAMLAAVTLTIRSRVATTIRVLLAFPIAYSFYDVAFGPYHSVNRGISMSLTLMGIMGLMKTIDVCLVSLLDPEPPFWVKDGKPVPLPTTVFGRLSYGFDLITSTRGSSWFEGYRWNWATKAIHTFAAPPMSRIQYLINNLGWLGFQYILIDAFDALNHSRLWNQKEAHPVTSLPFAQQYIWSFSVCACTALAITIPNLIYSTLSVAVGGSPDTWPPIMDHPFHATSLQDFWSNRWHTIFRRPFDRLVLPILALIPPKAISITTRRVIRSLMVFALSAIFHVFLIQRMLVPAPTTSAEDFEPASLADTIVFSFLDPSTFKFFLLQPLGLFIEQVLIVPLTSALPNRFLRVNVRRLWPWVWLLWSGRFWADAWVRGGMWNVDEGYVGWSPVRGLVYGEWWTV